MIRPACEPPVICFCPYVIFIRIVSWYFAQNKAFYIRNHFLFTADTNIPGGMPFCMSFLCHFCMDMFRKISIKDYGFTFFQAPDGIFLHSQHVRQGLKHIGMKMMQLHIPGVSLIQFQLNFTFPAFLCQMIMPAPSCLSGKTLFLLFRNLYFFTGG